MFWKILGSALISFFLVSDPVSDNLIGRPAGAMPLGLKLSQEKQILEWNLQQNLGGTEYAVQRIHEKINTIKRKDYRLFLDETTTLPKSSSRLRLSQENPNERKRRL
ncbi:MAG: hypothetical protein V4736_04960 [Bdellovibrionota bacterium]